MGYAGSLRPAGFEVESRVPSPSKSFAFMVILVMNLAWPSTNLACSTISPRRCLGTRCSSTAIRAYISATALNRISSAVRAVPSSKVSPALAIPQCDGIQRKLSVGESPRMSKTSRQVQAVGLFLAVATSLPSASSVTTLLQSMRIGTVGTATCFSACSTAQTSAPKIVVIHGGGTPYAMALMRPSASTATKAHPARAASGISPSSRDPSEYTVQSDWRVSPAGRMAQ